jgi:hypothetical protein
MELAEDRGQWRDFVLCCDEPLVLLPESVSRNQTFLFTFQRRRAAMSLSGDGDLLPELVARRVGRLHLGSGAAASCSPIVGVWSVLK